VRTPLLVLLAAGLALGADTPNEDAVKKEWSLLDGVWTLRKMEVDGKSLLVEGVRGLRMVIKGGKVTPLGAMREVVRDLSAVLINPGQSPKTLTLPNFEGGIPSKGVTLLAIYELRGNELWVCAQAVETALLKEREKERPRAFDSKQGLLLIFKREAKQSDEILPAAVAPGGPAR
jgi:uncharacterized protein (TIGR03067 family)